MRARYVPVPVLEQAEAEAGTVKSKMNPLKDPEGGVARVAGLMDAIVQCFKPGAKLTLVIRNLGYDNADAVLGNDEDPAGALARAYEQIAKRKLDAETREKQMVADLNKETGR